MKINWSKPPLTSQLGCDAWQDWNYEIFVNQNKITTVNKTTYFILTHIEPNSTYEVKIQPISKSGNGPMSEIFEMRSWPAFFENEPTGQIVTLSKFKMFTYNFLSKIIDETNNNFGMVDIEMGLYNDIFSTNRYVLYVMFSFKFMIFLVAAAISQK